MRVGQFLVLVQLCNHFSKALSLPPSLYKAAHASDAGRREKMEKRSLRGREQVPHHLAEDCFTESQHFGQLLFVFSPSRLVTSQVCHWLSGLILSSPHYPLLRSPVCRNHLLGCWASPPRGLNGFPLRLKSDRAAQRDDPVILLRFLLLQIKAK